MGKPYSMDLRERVVAAIEGGMSTRQAAARFAIGVATARDMGSAEASNGRCPPGQTGQAKGLRARCA
jgi:transposase